MKHQTPYKPIRLTNPETCMQLTCLTLAIVQHGLCASSASCKTDIQIKLVLLALQDLPASPSGRVQLTVIFQGAGHAGRLHLLVVRFDCADPLNWFDRGMILYWNMLADRLQFKCE